MQRADPETSKKPRPISNEPSVDLLNSGSSFDPVGWSDRGAEPISRAIRATVNPDAGGSLDGSLADSQVSLGDMPRGDEAIDIASILGQADGLEDTESIDHPSPAAKLAPKQPLLPQVKDPNEPAWRVKSARGVIYEMSSTDEVLDWLNEHTDWDKVSIARGLGPFLDVDSYPELERADESAPHSIVTADGSDQAPRFSDLLVGSLDGSFNTHDEPLPIREEDAPISAPLELDLSRASELHSGQSNRLGRAPVAQAAGVVNERHQSKPVRSELMTFRVPFVAAILTMAALVATTEAFEKRMVAEDKGATIKAKPMTQPAAHGTGMLSKMRLKRLRRVITPRLLRS